MQHLRFVENYFEVMFSNGLNKNSSYCPALFGEHLRYDGETILVSVSEHMTANYFLKRSDFYVPNLAVL
jgi:hypothetical protein